MRLNAAKTQMIVIGSSAMLRTVSPVAISFCGTTSTESKKLKNLRVIMDRHLNFVPHVDRVSQKCTGMLIALMLARHVIPRSALKRIVEGLVLSVLRTVCPRTARAVKCSSVAYKRLSTFAFESCLVGDVAKEFRVLFNS